MCSFVAEFLSFPFIRYLLFVLNKKTIVSVKSKKETGLYNPKSCSIRPTVNFDFYHYIF